jgi:hypothetical protein
MAANMALMMVVAMANPPGNLAVHMRMTLYSWEAIPEFCRTAAMRTKRGMARNTSVIAEFNELETIMNSALGPRRYNRNMHDNPTRANVTGIPVIRSSNKEATITIELIIASHSS